VPTIPTRHGCVCRMNGCRRAAIRGRRGKSRPRRGSPNRSRTRLPRRISKMAGKMGGRSAAARRLFECQAPPMPSVGSTTQHCNVPQAGGAKPRRCLSRPAIGFANQHDRFAAGDQFPGPLRQVGQGHVDGAWQMPRRRREFLRLAHIDQQAGIACGKTALQLDNLDRSRRIHASATKQAG
jgi:hypothetical protein